MEHIYVLFMIIGVILQIHLTNDRQDKIPCPLPSHQGKSVSNADVCTNEPPHDKTNKMSVRPAKTQISLGIRPV